jgi:PhnB protein
VARRAKAIPDGYHTVTPYLTVRGADLAITFYKNAFGAEELMRMPGPDGKSIMHAEIKIGDSRIFLSEEFLETGVPFTSVARGHSQLASSLRQGR